MIAGNRIYLKSLEREDLKDRLVWLSDPEVTRYFTNLGSVPVSEADMQKWFENSGAKKMQEMHFSIYTVDHQHIGGAQMKEIDWRNRSAEIGLFIGVKEQWGQGYGTEITGLLIKYAFLTLNLNRVWLRVGAGNCGAIQCYRKCGFVQEGVFRQEVYRDGVYHDSIVMSILQPEYEKCRESVR